MEVARSALITLKSLVVRIKMTILGGIYMNNNYPNLMCFGNEPHKCNCQESCPNYKECKESYYEKWFSFMEADHIKE